MFRWTLATIHVIALIASGVPAIAATDVTGNWARGDGNARIQIIRCGPQLCATNTWIGNTSRGEAIGDKLVMTLEAQSDSVLAGEAFDQKRDRTYSIRISVQQPSRMTISGCVLRGLLCKTENWTRIQ
jgi:uncharacterized protein (DUF2147 family)